LLHPAEDIFLEQDNNDQSYGYAYYEFPVNVHVLPPERIPAPLLACGFAGPLLDPAGQKHATDHDSQEDQDAKNT
jgi:hypothetical protein